jgi:DNA-directed RNA polymerase subunit omega
MARMTTGDCERFVPNRFELVLLAAERAHQLEAGAEPMIAGENEPTTVLALREIASGRIDVGHLRESLLRRHLQVDDDIIPFLEPSADWLEPSSRSDGSFDCSRSGKAPARVH